MKRLYTLQLLPGMTIAENVLNLNQQLVIPKDTVLTESLIAKLELYDILTVYVEDKVPTKENIQISCKSPSYSERLVQSSDFKKFKEDYKLNLDAFHDVINNVVDKNITLDIDTLLENSMDIISKNQVQFCVFDMLHNMHEYDDSTYSHCLNVALICNVFASWLRFSEKDIRLATACGLLHDIGKLLISHEILTKPGALTDDEYAHIQKHPIAGYQLLKKQAIDPHICYAALMHHERCDGSGYPMHLVGDQLDRFAKIVSIADVYDAMTAARVYRGPMCPFRVIEIFENDGYLKYDVEYLLKFLENVGNTYIQNRCMLSDGQEGNIVYINKEKLSRPIIQCDTKYINLIEHPNLSIQELL